MATVLQQQLAAIAANSTHQLDLKAQKVRHSKSLLFEPRIAASQNFETVFQICIEGFEELCALDSRFSPFARNLFSEQSKSEDRTRMTAQENEELDSILVRFLGLVSGRLLLKPAMKATEWLVRRFRVQDYNTECLLLAFLPYHTAHIFATVLSILPDQLPVSLKFLHPYVASLQSPPRHAVLSATIGTPSFLSAFSQFVLGATRAKNHSAILVGFWASIMAQAVNGMIDTSRSGREDIRRQREEDILLRVLPILQSALSIRDVPELYLGSCMIMTILATKASLDDNVLNAMMEAVAAAWTVPTLEDGLTCLAVVAEEKQYVSQPVSVTRRILRLEQAAHLLQTTARRHRTEKLVLATCLGSVESATLENQPDMVEFVAQAVDREMLSHRSLAIMIESLLSRAKGFSSAVTHDPTLAVLGRLAANHDAAQVLQKVALRLGFDEQQPLKQFAITLQRDLEVDDNIGTPEPIVIDQPSSDELGAANNTLSLLPDLDTKHCSMLDTSNDELFNQYVAAFLQVSSFESCVKTFVDLLTTSPDTISTALMTFFIRFWCSDAPVAVRARAIGIVTNEVRSANASKPFDLQFLFPYVLVALADDARRVRKAATGLALVLAEMYHSIFSKTMDDWNVRSWCTDGLYRSGIAQIQWLPTQDAQKLWNFAIVPALEDCVLDGDHIDRLLSEVLNGLQAEPGPTGKEYKQLKAALRSATCGFLATHVAATPALKIKLHLLNVLKGVGKTASDARKNSLLLFVQQWVSLGSSHVAEICAAQHVERSVLDKAILGSLSHRSIEEVQSLKMIVKGEMGSRLEARSIALHALKTLWPSMKSPSQSALADFLLDLSVDGPAEGDAIADATRSDALEMLQDMNYSSEVLVHMLDNIPSTTDLQEEAPPAKKRRTSKSEFVRPALMDTTKLTTAIKKITTVLEILENANLSRHPQLLRGLFHLLGELHHYKTLVGSQLVYLQGLLMSCLLTVVSGLVDIAAADIDRSVVRADLIVETMRTTTSTQVHNTALLLVSALASWAPDLVLHSVMPLFTFMSTTLLRQSDEYSAHVTDQTVARVVPPLAASLKKKGQDLVSGASELLLSFTTAYEHIPLHRRAGLFRHLVQTLGPEESLFAVVAMLVDRYSTDSRIIPFVKDLLNSFGALIQLRAFSQYMALVLDALTPKRSLSDTILGFGEKDSEQVIESVDDLLRNLGDLLRNPILRKRIAKELAKGGVEADAVQAIYANLLKQTMSFSPDADLKDATDSVLAALLVLTPTKDFIESSTILMQNGSDHKTHQQVFLALETRASQAKSSDPTLQAVYIDVLENCCFFIRPEQPVATRHAAITCVDQVVEKFGKTDRTRVVSAAQHIAGAAALCSDDVSLRVISILCLASMVEVLGDDFIPILPQVLGQTLSYLESTAADLPRFRRLHQAAFTFMESILETLPWMFSATNLDRALKFSVQSTDMADDLGSSTGSLERFCMLAARKLTAAECFAAVGRAWPEAVKSGGNAVRLLLGMLHAAVRHHTKSTMAKHTTVLFPLILEIFDTRRAGLDGYDDAADPSVVPGLGTLINALTLDIVLKLNDATFRPFFIRFVEWAFTALPVSDKIGRQERALSLYSFVHVLSEQLKSIVTSYASFVTENSASMLTSLSSTLPKERQLLVQILQTLTSLFQHDQDDFWQAPAHFDSIAQPIINQLSHAKAMSVTDAVIPAITELAVTVASPDYHKQMNTAIMLFMRSPTAEVRLAAVQAERAITERLNFDWLALLPEMLPFISELQEDDDEHVERETLRWVAQIEDVTGESFQVMMST